MNGRFIGDDRLRVLVEMDNGKEARKDQVNIGKLKA